LRAEVLGVLVRSLALCHQPLQRLPEWAAHLDREALGLLPDEVRLSSDDRVGRTLVSLFDADRASLLNRLLLEIVAGQGPAVVATGRSQRLAGED